MKKNNWSNFNFQNSINDLQNWFHSRIGMSKKVNIEMNGQKRMEQEDNQSDINFDFLQEIENKSPYVEHGLTIEQLADLYPLSRINIKKPEGSQGLNQEEAENSIKEQGQNVIKLKKGRKRDRLRIFFKQFLNAFRILLLIVAIACLVIYLLDQTRTKELTMSLILLVIFILLSIVGYVEQAKLARQIRGHQRIVPGSECLVIRESKELQLPANSLARGDLIWIKRGDRVAADCRLLYTQDFRVETSLLSGEVNCITYSADTVRKSTSVFEAQNLVFGGCNCTSGEAMGIVIRTGNNMLLGQLARMSNREKRKSRLELEYTNFSKSIILITLFMAATTFFVGLLLGGISNFNAILINGFFVVIMAAIPQGLPVILSAQLIIVARRLAKMGVYIKRADIADTLGLTSVLLVDKSTLLDPNKMQLSNIWVDRELLQLDNGSLKSANNILESKKTLEEIMDIISICNRSRHSHSNQLSDPKSGNKKSTLLRSFSSAPKNHCIRDQSTIKTSDSVLSDFVEQSEKTVEYRYNKFDLLFELPFSSSRRFHLAVLRRKLENFEDEEYLAVIKGAPEELIQNCNSIRVNNSIQEGMNDELLSEFEANYSQLASQGNTCIGFASMELEYFEDLPLDSLYENLLKSKKFCFLGMAGIVEPPLIGVEAAVLRAEQAGIRLFLVTGDHPRNAEVLARQIGFYNQNSTISTTSFGSLESLNTSSTSYEMSDKSSGSLVQLPIVLHGDNLNEMNEQEWSVILKHRRVIFARITPVQKVELIKHCHRLNYVVTLTGNELMDAKALREASVGIGTRMNGSIFANEAADIVATHSDLPNIVESIAQTRLLFDNFRKTLAYSLSHLLPELLPVLLSFIFGMPLGLNSLQALTIDLVTEIPPSVALILEPAERNIMKRSPRRQTARLVTPALLTYSYCIAGSLIGIGCMLSYLSVFWFHGLTTSDLLFTANHHWTQNSPILRTSTNETNFDGDQQLKIYQQACCAWHICLVFSQIFNLLSCTTRRSSLLNHGIKNPALVVAIVFKICFMLFIVFVEPIRWIVGVYPPPVFVWFIPLGVGILLLMVNELRKLYIRRGQNSLLVKMLRW